MHSPRKTRTQRTRLGWLLVCLIVAILLVDQALKFWVKTHMHLGEEIALIGNWAFLHFTENNGIAFGIEPNTEWLKLTLSLFRIVTVGGLIWLLVWLIRREKVPRGFIIGLGVIIAGAIGNIIDGTFYGLLFSSSEGLVLQGGELCQPLATFLPEGGGYAPLFHGKVVDMFYFPIVSFTWPQWVPGVGGRVFCFFQPIFNIADVAITAGTFYLLIFHWRVFFGKEVKPRGSK